MHVSRCGTAFHSPRHGTRSETPEARAPRGRLRAKIICSSRRRISSSDSHHRRWGDRGDRRGQDGKEKQFPRVGRLLHVGRLPERDEIEGPIHPGRGLVSRDRECGHLIFDHVVDATVGFEGGATRNDADVSRAVTGGVEAECWHRARVRVCDTWGTKQWCSNVLVVGVGCCLLDVDSINENETPSHYGRSIRRRRGFVAGSVSGE